MRTLTLVLPDAVDIDPQEASLILAMKLYESGKLSLGHAAALAGHPKIEFISVLSAHNVPVFNYPASDLARDVRNA